ncbi:hypothetical protein GCM10023325_04020 [Sphingomonas lutea]
MFHTAGGNGGGAGGSTAGATGAGCTATGAVGICADSDVAATLEAKTSRLAARIGRRLSGFEPIIFNEYPRAGPI